MNLSDRTIALRRLIATCAALAVEFDADAPSEADRAELRTIQDAIEQVWSGLAALAAATFPNCEAASDHPGYVHRHPVLVPYYLLHDIPSDLELVELVELGIAMRIGEGVVCLSGSTAMAGTIRFVGDVDFCEYASRSSEIATRRLVERIAHHATRATQPLCQRIKVFEPEWARTCPGGWDGPEPAAELTALIDLGAFQIKLDFIAGTEALGVLEATNMSLIFDPESPDRAIAASFAPQEVPFSGAPLPRRLSEPLQLGRYVNFLVREIEHYASASPVKGLKRGLSLVRLMHLSEWEDELLVLLQDPAGALGAAIASRRSLAAELDRVPGASESRQETLEALRAELTMTLATLSNAAATYNLG